MEPNRSSELLQSISVGIKSHWKTVKNVPARFITIGRDTAMAFLTNVGAFELCIEIYAVVLVGPLFLFLCFLTHNLKGIRIKMYSLQLLFSFSSRQVFPLIVVKINILHLYLTMAFCVAQVYKNRI